MVVTVLASATVFAFSGTAVAQDRDCADFSSRQEAQAAFESRIGDPERLDADNDNLACEALNGGGMTDPAEGEAGTRPPAGGGGGGDSGLPPSGGVETGHGGTAGSGAEVVLPLGLTGAALLAAGGALAVRRRGESG
ncbi:excalibur calcium-binding domain-containing protein [Saccharopolyspora griseoalba]|uniref:Excalibur calcium-binding domain-containing protein n=2 Tax=Saccharopolyspora griseoalba TaxID=1431848 RepID=A0ABW2LLE6_9PSEU